MLLHDGEFVVRQAARLEQDRVRDADLADVVQRCGLAQLRDIGAAQFRRKARVRLQLARQRFHVMLNAADVVGGFIVARFDQRGHGPDHRVQHLRLFAAAFLDQVFDQVGLVLEQLALQAQLQLGGHARQQRLRHHWLEQDLGTALAKAALLAGQPAGTEQEDDRNAGGVGIGLELLADVVAVQLRQRGVEQDQVRPRQLLGDAQRQPAVVGQLDFILVLQQAVHHDQVVRRLIDDEHYGLRFAVHVLPLPYSR